MSDILEKLNVCSRIRKKFRQKIHFIHIFDDIEDKNVFFTTNEDKVFAFGYNYFGQCGLGHGKKIGSPKELKELRGHGIKQFFIGGNFVLALNKENHVFGWGQNESAQLARGYLSSEREYLKPEIIPQLQNIVDISCGCSRSLALDSQGNVFGWGSNLNGQVGCGFQYDGYITTPCKLKSLPAIKSIYCFDWKSFAISLSGNVWIWGDNYYYKINQDKSSDQLYEPQLISGLTDVKSIGCSRGYEQTLFFTYYLTDEGVIYCHGQVNSNEYLNIKINASEAAANSTVEQRISVMPGTVIHYMNADSLQTISYYSNFIFHSKVLALAEESVHFYEGNRSQITNYSSFLEYCLNKQQITYKTVELLSDEQRFDLSDEIGSGGFGRVYKSHDSILDIKCALKRIKMTDHDSNTKKSLIKEVSLLSKCDSSFVARYYHSWIDQDTFIIKMELCSDNLQNIIDEKRRCFGRKSSKETTIIEYFICSQMIKEILECVQYLHELSPPIIHRDLKPANILVNYKQKFGKFFKICDFGLATYGSDHTIEHTLWKGTPRYMAPEVGELVLNRGQPNTGRNKYSPKADVFSLGRIFYDIFDIEFSPVEQEQSPKWKKINSRIARILNENYHYRPKCSEILKRFKIDFVHKITKKDLKSRKHLQVINQINNFDNTFLLTYLTEKTKYLYNK